MRLVLAALVLSGCAYTRPVSLASPQGRAEVNARAQRGHAVVSVAGGRGRQVRGLHLGPEVATWTDKKTGEPRSAPTADVTGVTFRRDGAGALKGLAVGAGVGAALGLLAGTGESDGFITLSPRLWAVVGAVDGAVVGVLAGAIHSERHAYRPLAGSPAASGPGTPAASGLAVEAGGPCGGPPLACAATPRRP